jgi:5'-nucleotidase
MDGKRTRSAMRILGLTLAALALIVPGTAQAKPDDVEVQLLAINDFHGNLEPPTGSSGRILPAPGGTNVDAGGAAFLCEPHPRAARHQPQLAGGLGRRPDRRQPAAVGRVP